MTILFAGGGTMGPVTPLLAVMRAMRRMHPGLSFAWAGTPNGPERAVVEREGIPFFAVPVAKLPRYVSLEWLTWWRGYAAARKESLRILEDVSPSLVVSAGGFTAVPVIRAAAHRGIPCAIHQLDWVAGLSNRLVARRCRAVTSSFLYGRSLFGSVATERVPTPSRFSRVDMPSPEEARAFWGWNDDRPVVFITGGGTGAIALNEMVWGIEAGLLERGHVIHQTGKGKAGKSRFLSREFLSEEEMRHAFAAADVVVTRAGMGALSECAALAKPAIVVPIPNSPQEENAEHMPYPVVHQKHGAGHLLKEIDYLLEHPDERTDLGDQAHEALPTDDGTALAKRWLELRNT